MNQEPEISTQSRKWRPGPVSWLALLILLAFVIRIVAALTRPMIEMDETSYVRMAQNLAAGHGPFEITGVDTTNFSPLFPLLIAGLAALLRDYVVSAYAVAAIFGALLLLPVYLLGKELGSSRVGLMAAALVAVLPIYVDNSALLDGENVYVFFLLMSVVFARHVLRGCRVPCSTLTGASLGLAYLADPSAVIYLVIFMVLALVAALKRGILPQMVKAVVILLLLFSLYAVPYWFFLHGELGHWTDNGRAPGNSYAASLGLRQGDPEWDKEMLSLTDDGALKLYRLTDSADPVGNLFADPAQSLRNLAIQANYLYTKEAARAMPLWLPPLLGLGLFGAGWNRRRATGVGYLLVMMLPGVMVFTVYSVRTPILMPLVALTLIWVAQGWERLEQWAGESLRLVSGDAGRARWQARTRGLIGVLVLAPVMALSAVTVTRHDYQTGYRDAGESLVRVSNEDTRIMSRETAAAFYSGGELIWLPDGNYDQVTGYSRKRGVDFLVINRRDLDEFRPTLALLLGDPAGHPEWRLINTVDAGTNQETYIFELDSPPVCGLS